MNSSPRVFISHASEDKERFVFDFAIKLRAKGVDAWVDQWEILPGDSLVQKIFNEGLGEAEAAIIVLSQNSVNKKWVQEELDVSVVLKIKGQIRLIPVVLDDCTVPNALIATKWVKIPDITSYYKELDQIAMTIFGVTAKPPLGTPPRYVQTEIDEVPGLSKVDSIVLKLACEKVLETGSPYVQTATILPDLEVLGIPVQEFSEALEILYDQSLIAVQREFADNISFLEVTLYGFDQYAHIYIKSFDDLVMRVGSLIVNEGIITNNAMAQTLAQPLVLIDHILKLLTSNDFIEITEAMGDDIQVIDVKAKLKRKLRG
ncbi:MAG: toll/interleukin-1 receptor domain-containing protein [Chloroflexota bacterium]